MKEELIQNGESEHQDEKVINTIILLSKNELTQVELIFFIPPSYK